jgi:hypothetical protein
MGTQLIVDRGRLAKDGVRLLLQFRLCASDVRCHLAKDAGQQVTRAADDIILGSPRSEEQPHHRGDQHANQDRRQPVGSQQEDLVGMFGAEQRHHRGGIPGKYRPVGQEAVLDIVRSGAEPDR